MAAAKKTYQKRKTSEKKGNKTDRQTDRQTSSALKINLKTKSKQKPIPKFPLEETPELKHPAKGFPIIGMGASAGGLDALEKFFKNMPPDSGAAFVIISHLSPDQKSLMPEILQKHTKMLIYQIEEGMNIKPNHIYVIPPNQDAVLKDGTLHLIAPYISKGIRHPIDVFFRSLADAQAEKAICVILSGTGTEGTLGLKAVKAEGGIVIAQQPESATYDGMPASAIGTGLVDYIASPEEMPGQIIEYIKRSFGKVRVPIEKEIVPPDTFYTVLAVIREYTGHDFSDYKPTTIKRRIEKRMVIHNIEDIRTYVRYLRENPKERQALFKEFLISVTKFFRDPGAFTYLKEDIFHELFSMRPDRSPIRIWVVGCATGEEAYSIAIILKEYMEEHATKIPVQIFATDIDSEAIDTARAGIFPEGIAVDVSEERLKKYFTREKNMYRIKKPLREMVVFSLQNVIKDPPFSKIDLVCCRNLLIYVNAKLQKKMFSIFHYALNPDGILFLGTSESIGESINLFSVVDGKWKVYRRLGGDSYIPYREFDIGVLVQEHMADRAAIAVQRKSHLPESVQQMLYSFTPACIVLDEKMQIRYFHGNAGRYLAPPQGEARLDLLGMVKDGLKNRVFIAIQEARQKKQNVALRPVHVKLDGEYVSLTVSVRLLNQPGMIGWVAVLFEEEKEKMEKKTSESEFSVMKKTCTNKEARKLIVQLEDKLKKARQSHQMTTEELETSNEELQSANEELQSSNEELQSTNEELETSREELQSLNEELATVNAELQEKIQEQVSTTQEVESLLSNMDIATIFLDSNLRVLRFTPQATNVTNLLDRDIGRPFRDIKKSIMDMDVDNLITEVMKTMQPKQLEVQGENGSLYLMRIIPYRGTGEKLEGVALTFVDMNEVSGLRETGAYADSVADIVREAFIELDHNLRIVIANRAFYDTFRTRKEETIGKDSPPKDHAHGLCGRA
jgi:two-component system CheB/CheR fusion protein